MKKMKTKKRLVKADLVSMAAQADPALLVQLCERDYAAGLAEAAKKIIKKQSRIIMLAGPSGGGKTTTANRLAETLTGMGYPAGVVHMDDFYKNPEEYPKQPDGKRDTECVEALDLKCLHRCLRELMKTGKTVLPQYDFRNECRKEEGTPMQIENGAVIVEGIHALNPIVTDKVEKYPIFRIFVGLREEYCDAEGEKILSAKKLRLGRRILRDTLGRGHNPQATIEKCNAVNRGEDTNIRPYKKKADCILDTGFTYEPCVMAGLLPQILDQVPPEADGYALAKGMAAAYRSFAPIDPALIPQNSMMQEFLSRQENG